MNIKKIIIFKIFIVSSCAQIVAPSGGIKDELPPVVVSEKPINNTTNFKSNQITIKFNEYINIVSQEQIIISPPPETKPFIETSGKQLIIKFNDTLHENTTYTINFSNSIVDVNEGNALQNYTFVFSTGNFIDSNYIQGILLNSFNKKPEKDFNVCLYKTIHFTDSTLQKKLPDYFAKTDNKGRFTIKNLPNDNFYLYAFKDENKNLKFDLGEDIAFLNYTINTSILNDSLTLLSNKTSPYKPGYVKDTSFIANGIYGFYVFKPTYLKVETTNKSTNYSKIIKGKDGFDSVYLYLPNQQAEEPLSLKFIQLNEPDSANIVVLKSRKQLKNKPLEINTIYPQKPNDSLTLVFNNPVILSDEQISKIQILKDSIPIQIIYAKQSDAFTLKVYSRWMEDVNYDLFIPDSLFTDIFNQGNKQVKANFRSFNLKDFGSIKLHLINNKNRNLIVQLVTADEYEAVLASYSISQTTTIENPFISPATLKIKIIVDENQNGIWDKGDFKTKKQAETIFYHNDEYTIKAFWDIEQTIQLD